MSALNCNCRSELEAKLTERFKKQAPEATDHSVSLEGYGFGIANGVTGSYMAVRGLMPYRTTANFPLKKGGTKHRTTKGNMIFSYCPFCGVKGE